MARSRKARNVQKEIALNTQTQDLQKVQMPAPSKYVLEIQSRRLASAIPVRLERLQLAKVKGITQKLQKTDQEISDADVVRRAIDFFIHAWEEQYGKIEPDEG